MKIANNNCEDKTEKKLNIWEAEKYPAKKQFQEPKTTLTLEEKFRESLTMGKPTSCKTFRAKAGQGWGWGRQC